MVGEVAVVRQGGEGPPGSSPSIDTNNRPYRKCYCKIYLHNVKALPTLYVCVF